MIKSFKRKGLEKFYSSASTKGIQAKHAKTLRMLLIALDTTHHIEDLAIPGYWLHQLKGGLKGCWSITVNAY